MNTDSSTPQTSGNPGQDNPPHDSPADDAIIVDFCGIQTRVTQGPFTIGRSGDLALDSDNRHLHRTFLQIDRQEGVWMLTNVGSYMSARVTDSEGRVDALLAPGARLPLVEPTVVSFTAGPTNYELILDVPAWHQAPTRQATNPDSNDDRTVGRISMTPDQFLLILALAEPSLVGAGRVGSVIPSSAEAAARLGWTLTKFNRKLDNVCSKLSRTGVSGLHGEPGNLASQRRTRLVEHAVTARLVTADDLILLETNQRGDRVSYEVA